MAQQFFIVPTSPSPYIACTVNNIDLIITLNNEKKNWTKKYYKIIRGLETMADIQHQLQNITQLAEVVNIQLVEIKTTILQASKIHKMQNRADIFSISQELQNIIQDNMENQAHHVQIFLADKLDNCKGKENIYADKYIEKIQSVYRQES